MYVRCSVDFENKKNPRNFAVGQIIEVNAFAETVKVKFCDPFGYKMMYESMLLEDVYTIESVQRCTMFLDSYVAYNSQKYKVIECEKKEDWYYYHIQNVQTKHIIKVREDTLVVPFTNGQIQPYEQLMNYEFQNPCWYLGRNVVSKAMNILDNSFYGFKELAGCKIFLLPHQLKTIMRCLQNEICRVLLADEVGMGKTIEALSVLKIYLSLNNGKRLLIAVPKALYEQWKTEMFFKFSLCTGIDKSRNQIELKAIEDIELEDIQQKWDFLILDEVHKLLHEESKYEKFHQLSKNSTNALLLSATPVQQKEGEYLKLVRLIFPEKYDNISLEEFKSFVDKQKTITKAAYIVLMNFEDYQEQVENVLEDGENPIEDEECQDLYDEIESRVKKLNKILNDKMFGSMVDKLEFESEDYGITAIQELMAYVCENYQIERNIIRNRRKYISDELPKRTLEKVAYSLDADKNTYEFATYEAIVNWIVNQEIDQDTFKQYYVPLLEAFFSSPWAFIDKVKVIEMFGFAIDETVKEQAELWLRQEQLMIEQIQEVMNDPDLYESRILKVIDYLSEEEYEKKVVVFTNHSATFEIYRTVLESYFESEEVAFFQKYMSSDELELHAYRFQNDAKCKIMLCDESGGEGRNFQCAEEVLHIDMPWDANAIEQRIGRLDRLGRDAECDVKSVVFYVSESLEEELLNFWDKGLGIFEHSLSGLEIIMSDINEQIINAVTEDFRYGLTTAMEKVIELSSKMESEIREEQHYDTAGYVYATINQRMNKIAREYHDNENNLFASTMMSWASLAGLRPYKDEQDCISFSDVNFSVKSAENAMLIPPKWDDYMGKKENQFVTKIRRLYEDASKQRNVTHRSIHGTFDRKHAIENDYLHFFSPGDEIFDCIVDNALHSCRGQVAAFAVKASIEWMGLVFTYSIEPDKQILLENNVLITALGAFRNYLAVNQITMLAPTRSYTEVPHQDVLDEFAWISQLSVSDQKKYLAHLGKRTPGGDFLHFKDRYRLSNMDWFRKKFTEEKWKSYVVESVRSSREEAWKQFKKKSNLKEAENEMRRILSFMKAGENYYGLSTGNYEKTKEQFKVILEALGHPKMKMESASFVWMVKE